MADETATPPTAPEATTPPADAALPGAPSADGAPAPVAGDDAHARELRDRLAQNGRQLAEERRARERAESQVVALNDQIIAVQRQLAAVGQRVEQGEQQRMQAYLNSLPPAQRLAAQVQMQERSLQQLRQQLAQARQPQRRQYSQQEIEVYRQEQSRRILEDMNRQYGLSGDSALTGQEDELDWEGEAQFRQSAATLAKVRAKNGAAAVATKKAPEASDREALKREILAELGVGGSNAAKPASAPKGGVSTQDFQQAQSAYKSKGGIKAQIEATRALVEAARSGKR